MSFLPIAIAAYILNGLTILIDKILIKNSLPNPLTYTFYVNILQIGILVAVPFGFHFTLSPSTFFAIASGILSVFALHAFFVSLKINDASVVGPVVGVLNPLFALLLGDWFLNHAITPVQRLAFFISIIGAAVITFNIWSKKLQINRKLTWMVVAGFLFAMSYSLLHQAFLGDTFLNVLVISRTSAGILALSLLLIPALRLDIFTHRKQVGAFSTKTTWVMLLGGQALGALSGFLITYGVSLASAALVNSVFGVQYLVILIGSYLLAFKHSSLLDEKLTKTVMFQKIVGSIIISIGLYLLSI